MAVGQCVAFTHVKRSLAELDVALYDKAHSFLNVSFGNTQGAASIGQTALWKHFQQMLLLGLPLRHWLLGIYTKVLGPNYIIANYINSGSHNEKT